MHDAEWLAALIRRLPDQAATLNELFAQPSDDLWAALRAARIPEAEALAAAGEVWRLPVAVEIPDDWLDAGLVAQWPVDWARRHTILPALREGERIALMARPEGLERVEEMAALLDGPPPHPWLAPEAAVRRAIERCYFQPSDDPRAFAREAHAAPEPAAAPVESRADDLLRRAEGAPVTQLANGILLEALRARASDIHLEPQDDRLRVRYRIDGGLYDQPVPPRALEAALISRLKVMARLDITERRLPQDGMARVRVGDREIDLRVSTVPVSDGERVVLRLLHREQTVRPLGELGLGPEVLARWRALLEAPQGILLVTGPTGSGKTTTLYATLQELDTRRRNILTIEDPIEYRLPAISQLQVNPKIELTFARCLRHVLRQDPDVVLVGETRDLETAEIAIRASLTGHLVFTTLHTNDALGAALRLTDMGVEPYLLSAALRGVLAQRLVRRLCPRCRDPRALDAADWGGPPPAEFAGRTHWRARGCDACLDGYLGRLGIFELLPATEELTEAIRRASDLPTLRAAAARGGWRTLWDDGLEKVWAGDTSLDEARRVAGR